MNALLVLRNIFNIYLNFKNDDISIDDVSTGFVASNHVKSHIVYHNIRMSRHVITSRWRIQSKRNVGAVSRRNVTLERANYRRVVTSRCRAERSLCRIESNVTPSLYFLNRQFFIKNKLRYSLFVFCLSRSTFHNFSSCCCCYYCCCCVVVVVVLLSQQSFEHYHHHHNNDQLIFQTLMNFQFVFRNSRRASTDIFRVRAER